MLETLGLRASPTVKWPANEGVVKVGSNSIKTPSVSVLGDAGLHGHGG